MGNRYDLDTMEGRVAFDQMIEQYIAMDQDIADYNTEQYAKEVWENLEITNELEAYEEYGIDFVNDFVEAEARVRSVVSNALKAEQEWRKSQE